MQVDKINCINFRNISFLEVEPCEKMNVIYGENAQGKTNFLEAIWLFTGAKSFRNSKDSAFLKKDVEKGFCELEYSAFGIKKDSKIEFTDKRKAFLNGKELSSPSKLAGNFNAVVFSPNDLSLVSEGPSIRRNFLDLAVGQLYPAYIKILKNYSRAVIQRNQIIKDLKYDASLAVMLDVFEEEIAQNGIKIIESRKKYLERIKKFIPKIYEGLSSGREKIEIEYICSCDSSYLKEGLKNSRKEDMLCGVTSLGPHRDDISFSIDKMNARAFGSQGQKRSIALSVKLAQAEVIKEVLGESPVCLLDDVMSELDLSRQNYVLNHIKGCQSFLTCCDPSNYKGLEKGKIFKMENGKIVRENPCIYI